ncbi:MAG TPA: molybdopterin-dependent oxidoreductase, partial [Actinomycetota bacterium]|nr:molybdopterin-dependent oxidoreductase [Actinomycetota bacterium]
AQDMFVTETTKHADVLLPVAALYERAGTVINWEGRAQTVEAAVPPPGQAQRDFEILAQIARVLGVTFPHTLEQLRTEMRSIARAGSAPERLQPVAPAEASASSEALTLVTYPMLIDDGTMMARADLLRESVPEPALQIHAADAERIGIADGDDVRLRIAGEEPRRARAHVTEDVAPGVVAIGVRRGADMRAPGTGVAVEKVSG